MASVVPAKEVVKEESARVAGLLTTDPLVLNCDPWHGQMKVWPETFVMVQPSCVQTAVRAENASCEIRVTRKLPRPL